MTSPTSERRRGLLGSTGFKAPVTVLAAGNITQYGEQTIDGKALLAVNADGVPDRVACVGQTDAKLNGIWDVSTAAWTRSLDANQNYDFKKGTTVIITDGTLYAGTYWNVTAAAPITLGTTLMTWARALANSISTLFFTQAGVGAVVRGAQDKMREVISVKDFGAVGDGVTDDTVAIQAAITYICSSNFAGGILLMPSGKYRITSTLVFPNRSGGGVVAGSGIAVDSAWTPRLGSNTILFWDGVVGGTMISQEAALGWTFRDFTMVGKLNSGGASLAGIGYLLTGLTSGGGSGVGRFESVEFQYITTAVQFGSVLGEAGNDADIVFEQCSWNNCDTGIIINVVQGLNYNINSASVVALRRFVYAPLGSSITVSMANFSNCGDATDPTGWIFSGGTTNNSGNLVLENCRLETGGGGTEYCQQFVNITSGRCTLIGVTENQEGQSDVLMIFVDGGQLTMRDCRWTTKGVTTQPFKVDVGGGNLFAKLTIEDTDFLTPAGWVASEWITLVNRNAPNVVSVERCRAYITSGDFRPIPFTNSSLPHGPVTQQTTANGAASRDLTFIGINAAGRDAFAYIPDGSAWIVTAYIVGSTTDGATVFAGVRRCVIKQVAGTVSQVGATEVIGTDVNPGGWGLPTMNVSNGTKSVNVTAPNIAATITNWGATLVGTPVMF